MNPKDCLQKTLELFPALLSLLDVIIINIVLKEYQAHEDFSQRLKK